MIELIHLEKKYGETTPLKDVNTVIKDGDVISVIGPSGTGKSTLLRCINMLERPTGGQIILDGEDITSPDCDLTLARRKMGMVFQSFNLFAHLTVIENLMLAPMDILKKSKQEAYDIGKDLLKKVGLAGQEFKYPDQLSGGEHGVHAEVACTGDNQGDGQRRLAEVGGDPSAVLYADRHIGEVAVAFYLIGNHRLGELLGGEVEVIGHFKAVAAD